jgi:CspA family cold shock protein
MEERMEEQPGEQEEEQVGELAEEQAEELAEEQPGEQEEEQPEELAEEQPEEQEEEQPEEPAEEQPEEPEKRLEGTVKWFSDRKGYGFIVREGGNDVFIHFSGIRAGGPRSLYEGDKVEFSMETDQRGPRATDLVVTEAAERPSYSRY